MNSQHDMAWPSYSRICAETGLSRASVAKYLEVLESEGWLLRDRGSKGKNTIYMAAFPANVEKATSLAGELLKDPTSMRDRLTSMRAKPELVRHANTNKQSNKQVNKQNTLSLNIIESGWDLGKDQIEVVKYNRPELLDTVEDMAMQFITHHLATGDCFQDWNARWESWVLRER